MAPAALVLSQPGMIATPGAIVAAELYGIRPPMVQRTPDELDGLAATPDTSVQVTVDAPSGDRPAILRVAGAERAVDGVEIVERSGC